ncbi:MAG: hypothetical protein AAF961_10835, partial [Planctomycetota bacterium]
MSLVTRGPVTRGSRHAIEDQRASAADWRLSNNLASDSCQSRREICGGPNLLLCAQPELAGGVVGHELVMQ